MSNTYVEIPIDENEDFSSFDDESYDMERATQGIWTVYNELCTEYSVGQSVGDTPERFEMYALVCANHVAQACRALEGVEIRMGVDIPTGRVGGYESNVFAYRDAANVLVAASHLFALVESRHRDKGVYVYVDKKTDVRGFMRDQYAYALGICLESVDQITNESVKYNIHYLATVPMMVCTVFLLSALGFKDDVYRIARTDFDNYACEIVHGLTLYANAEFSKDAPEGRRPEGVDVVLVMARNQTTYIDVETMCRDMLTYAPFDLYAADKIYALALSAAENLLCIDAATLPRPENVYALLRAYDAVQTYLCPCWPTTFPGLRAAQWKQKDSTA